MKLFEIDGNNFDWTPKDEWEGNILKMKYNEGNFSYAIQKESTITIFISVTNTNNDSDMINLIKKAEECIDSVITKDLVVTESGKESPKINNSNINHPHLKEKYSVEDLLKLKEKFSVEEIKRLVDIGLL